MHAIKDVADKNSATFDESCKSISVRRVVPIFGVFLAVIRH